MKKRLFRFLLIIVVLAVAGVSLILFRNFQMDNGVRALKEGNGAIALGKLKPLAQLGDQDAQFLVGSIYAYGWGGISKNDDQAIYWFQRCGRTNTSVDDDVAPLAQHELNIAKTYANGDQGVKADSAESIKWLQRAARDGSKEAVLMLANKPVR